TTATSSCWRCSRTPDCCARAPWRRSGSCRWGSCASAEHPASGSRKPPESAIGFTPLRVQDAWEGPMRIGIVVDSACDLPASSTSEHGIVVMPITVRTGNALLEDRRDEKATLAFLHAHVAERGHEAETTPLSVEQIRDLFLQRLVIDYDHVFCLTISRLRSQIHDNALQASYAILNEYKPVRQAAGITTPFALRVIDSLNLFVGQAITAVEAVRMRAAGAGVAQMRARLEEMAQHTCGFMIPRDLYYLRNRARTKGDRSVGLLSAALGSALDIKPVIRAWRGTTEPVGRVK